MRSPKSCFVRGWLAARRGRVINLDLLTYAGNLDSLADVWGHSRHVFSQGDIADGALIKDLLESLGN